MKRQTILLVDDSNTALMVEQMILSTKPYRLLIARDGAEAVAIARSRRPDLILMDIVMPGMNGIEACKILHEDERTKDIPIIMVTTRGEMGNIEAAYMNGCADYVTKPIDGFVLATKISNLIGH